MFFGVCFCRLSAVLVLVLQTFLAPFDVAGNVIIFAAVLLVVIDVCRGGLED